MWESRSRWMLVLSIAGAGLLCAQFVLFVLRAMLHWRIPFNLIDGCMELFRFIGFPVAIALMMTFLTSSLVLFAGSFAGYLYTAVRWRMKLRNLVDLKRTRAVRSKHAVLGNRIVVLASDAHVAMTMGLFKPVIVLSTGLLALLDRDELDAVIAHERCHMIRRDPLALFVLSLLRNAMWYIPMFEWVLDKYRTLIEAMADRYAIISRGSSEDLGSALLKLVRKQQAYRSPSISASFAETSINLRIQLILDPDFKVPLRLPYVRLGVSVISFLVIAFLV